MKHILSELFINTTVVVILFFYCCFYQSQYK